jgi:hypothetical protein
MNARANGRIVIETQTCDLSKTHLPEPPDVTRCLAILWSLSTHDVTTPTRNPEKDMPRVSTKPPSCTCSHGQTHPRCPIHATDQPRKEISTPAAPSPKPNLTIFPDED